MNDITTEGAETPGTAGRTWIQTGLVLFLFAGVLAMAVWYGPAHRRYSPETLVLSLPSHADAVAAWKDAGVAGRTLVLFDSMARHEPTPWEGATPDDGYVHQAIREGLVRKVIYVVPESIWPEVKGELAQGGVFSFRGGAYQTTSYGVPVTIGPFGKFEPPRERVLVHINVSDWDAAGTGAVVRLMGDGLSWDVATYAGRRGPGAQAELDVLHAKVR